ncbi:2-C-methyl-D-erythritol 4-phosphate cytidylyltransferase [Demequina globuliformis]|uniref:2-C-methyl-D-erythritol 4-phosphate cytidylyltransferase n=1 Tax=Demequina globuliformis TaxID=676202 RepID=UPI000785AECE|nr:2-C-methyl-D-erythritol 4-phosphate cytidylyltransferase [Demequina globuliformis]
MTIAAVITAAGSGTRLGADVPKALVPVHGRSLVEWAVAEASTVATDIVVTAPRSHLEAFRAALPGVTVVAGGADRQSSVAAGLDALPAGASIVLIHDAARAFQPAAVMRATVDAVRGGADGAIPVVDVIDTLVTAPGRDGEVGDPVDRAQFRAVQTPQTFRVAAILDAHHRGKPGATDDATLARELGYRVLAVPGHEDGFKVTRPADLSLAKDCATRRQAEHEIESGAARLSREDS